MKVRFVIVAKEHGSLSRSLPGRSMAPSGLDRQVCDSREGAWLPFEILTRKEHGSLSRRRSGL
jgi:hypothetical protein